MHTDTAIVDSAESCGVSCFAENIGVYLAFDVNAPKQTSDK